VEGVDGARIAVPAGALAVTATVSIARDSTDAPPAPSGMRTLGDVFAVTPHGARFAEPVEVTIPFDVQALPAGRKPALLKVSPGQPWQVIENVTVNGNRITARVGSLSWLQPISVPDTGFVVGVVNPSALPPSNVPSYQLSFESSNWQVLPPTGVDATIVQQQLASEPARIRSAIHLPEDSELVQTCDASHGNVRVNVNRISAAVYRRPADPVAGTNRVALDFNIIETLTTQSAFTTTSATALLDVSTVDARWSPPPFSPYNALLGIRTNTLPPDGLVDGPAWQVEVEVVCMPQSAGLWARPLWTLQPAMRPIVVVRGFAPARIGIAAAPSSTTLLDGQSLLLEAFAALSDPNDGSFVSTTWERANAGSNTWVEIAASPFGTPPPTDRLYHEGTMGPLTRLKGAVRAATDNGARLRARFCLPATATAAAECSTSPAATLTVSSNFPAPRFTTQPRSQTMQSGQTLALFVEFSGFPVPTLVTWQTRASDTEAWQAVDRNIWRNSVRPENITYDGWNFLSQADDRLVSTRPLTVADRGRQFRATYTTVAGTATSAGATINVTTGQTPPRVTAQPLDITVASGQTAVFAAAADGAAPLSYQWLFNGQRIPGANAPTLALGSANAGNAGLYTLEVSNVEDTVRSQAARLSVTGSSPPPAVAPTITTAPLSQTVTAGGGATLAVVAAGTGPLSYQWLRDGQFVPGATSPVLTLSNLGVADSSNWNVLVFNAAGSVTSSAATLTVQAGQPPVTQAPAISTQPTGQVLTLGQRAVFAVAASGSVPLSYLWERDGTALQGATGAVLVIEAVGAADAGSYRVTLSNGAGTVTSSAAGLVVVPPPDTPVITNQPAGAAAVEGSSATFFAAATGNPAPRCQWTRNGIAIAGATSCSSYSTPPAQQADNGAVYNLLVYSSGGVALGNGALLTVQALLAPTITTQPQNATVTEGASAGFNVAASSNGALTFQWLRNGTPITGGTDNFLPTGATTLADNGASFSARVCTGPQANNLCTLSSPATLTVNVLVPANALTATQVLAGHEWSVALRPDRTVWAWGGLHRNDGQVQIVNMNPALQATRPVRMYPAVLTDIRQIDGWYDSWWAIKGEPGTTESRLLHWGRSQYGSDGRGLDGNGSPGSSGAWGAGRFNEASPVEALEQVAGVARPADRLCSVAGGSGRVMMIRAIDTMGVTTSCAPGAAKTVWFIGPTDQYDSSTGLVVRASGLPTGSPPAAVFTSKPASAYGSPYTLLLEDGRIFAFGNNYYDALGLGAGNGWVAGPAAPAALGSGWGTVRATAGGFYGNLFALRADGTVMTGGYATNGYMGLGPVADGITIPGPVPVLAETCTSLPCADTLSGVTSVASTYALVTLALKNGLIYTWGARNQALQGATGLGNDPVLDVQFNFPRLLPNAGSGYTALSASNVHALVIGPGNVVYAWGSGWRFALGDGQDGSARRAPVMVTVP